MHLSRTIVTIAVFASMLLPQTVLADGAGAVAAMYRTMANVGFGWDVNNQKNIQAIPTLVRGIYKVVDKSSSGFLGYINEGGTLLGDYQGWKVWARQPRPMNSSELAELRSEIIRNIDLAKLIKVEYGDGGGRRMVIFSAVDCPFCRKFETSAAKLASSMNTTFYVVPSALRPISYGAIPLQNWRTVAGIWCAKDNAAAWRAYWSNIGFPQSHGCSFDERQAEEMDNQLSDLLASVGIKKKGVPAILLEDGTVFTPRPDFDKAYAVSTFGAAGLPSSKSTQEKAPLKWLAISESPVDAQPIDAQPVDTKPGDSTRAARSSNESKVISINLGGALQKFFQK